MAYYNTTGLEGLELSLQEAKALGQEELIAEIFKANQGKRISPSMMQKFIKSKYGRPLLLTSVRRGMCNLAKGDPPLIQKVEDKKMMVQGPYGNPEHVWMLRAEHERPTDQLRLFPKTDVPIAELKV
jgi:hypothetical protein